MNSNEYNKIIIVSLCERLTKSVAKRLSSSLEMMYCDSKDLVEYELIDKKTLKKVATKEYFDNAEKSVFKHISSFTNVVVAINFDYLSHNWEILKENAIIVFLKLPRTYIKEHSNVINFIAYEDRSSNLEKLSTLTVSVKKTEPEYIADKIIEEIGRKI